MPLFDSPYSRPETCRDILLPPPSSSRASRTVNGPRSPTLFGVGSPIDLAASARPAVPGEERPVQAPLRELERLRPTHGQLRYVRFSPLHSHTIICLWRSRTPVVPKAWLHLWSGILSPSRQTEKGACGGSSQVPGKPPYPSHDAQGINWESG